MNKLSIRKSKKLWKIYIDQSGKIEQTNKDTVIAYSNHIQYSVSIKKKVKRQLQELFRLTGFTRIYTYYLFAIGIFFLIDHLKAKTEVIIDIEYPGRDRLINNIIKSLLESEHKPQHNISFTRIGNHPKAHYAAKDIFDKKRKPDKILSIKDIIKAIKKTDGRLRECLSTLVDAQPRSIKRSYQRRNKKSR